jgi:hypothetical protein
MSEPLVIVVIPYAFPGYELLDGPKEPVTSIFQDVVTIDLLHYATKQMKALMKVKSEL